MSHNFFNDDKVLKEYIKMRHSENPTDIIEKPAIKRMLPLNLNNKRILDIGCGYGEMSKYFIDNGAKLVVAIDISEKMIQKAMKENYDKKILYICGDIANLNEKSSGRFDIVYSSFALHFVESLDKLFAKLNQLLNDDGDFVFSIEHPIMTATMKPTWNVDEKQNIISYNLNGYYDEKYKEGCWFTSDIIVGCYHRKISTIVNLLLKNGFEIVQIDEPEPKKNEMHEKLYQILSCRPMVVVFKCKKRRMENSV